MAAAASLEPVLKPRLRGVLHQWAFVVSLLGGGILVLEAGSARARLAVSVYGLSVAGLFGASALYHRIDWRGLRARRWMRRLDHTMIFVLIAGSYTPFGLLVLSGTWRIAVLATVFTSHGGYTSPAAYVHGLTPALWVGVAVLAAGALIAAALPFSTTAEAAAQVDTVPAAA